MKLKIPKRIVSSPQHNRLPSPWKSENQFQDVRMTNKNKFNQIATEDEVLRQNGEFLQQNCVPNLNLSLPSVDNVDTVVDEDRFFQKPARSGVVCAMNLEDLRRERRKLSNRESAKRSRLRKQQERDQLDSMIDEKETEIRQWAKQLRRKSDKCFNVSEENRMLEEELIEFYGPAALDGLVNPEHQTNANCSTKMAICKESSTPDHPLEARQSPSCNY